MEKWNLRFALGTHGMNKNFNVLLLFLRVESVHKITR